MEPDSSLLPSGLPSRAETRLKAANAELHRQIAARERLEQEHRKAERALHEHHARFQSAFGNALIGMALVDMEGLWLEVNDSLCRITVYARDQLVALTLPDITHPEDVELDAQQRRDLLAGGIPSYQIEKRYRHAWGHYVWVLVTVSLVRDDQDRALYAISQIQDITERKELSRRLEYLIDHDFLTGLVNMRRFEKEVDLPPLFGPPRMRVWSSSGSSSSQAS